MGVLTGEAAVTLAATNQGMVAGDLVNTAARLPAAAPPGRSWSAKRPAARPEKAIAFEEAGAQGLKGKTVRSRHGELCAWSPSGWRAGGGRDLPEPPFVGREEEMRLLKDLL